jgi:hypothetical protein
MHVQPLKYALEYEEKVPSQLRRKRKENKLLSGKILLDLTSNLRPA